MFKMMNNERLSVGIQGLGCAEIAYQNALAYAHERRQSKAPPPRPDDSKAADPIVYQPEIKRLLLRMRSQVEGARALAVLAALHVDTVDKASAEEARAEAGHLVALLTPVIKAYFSDLGVESALAGQQIYGGHGYIREHGMEQLVRDARIAQIYEGTNEVQALDLVARKLTGATGEFADRFLAGQKAALDGFAADESLAFVTGPALAAHTTLLDVTAWIRGALQGDFAAAQGAATRYLRLFALTVIGCLWAGIVASIRGKEGAFYTAKRKLAAFYMQQVLPETASLAAMITAGSTALAQFDVADFGD
jgi:butyryl-CoA dehydrogenase